MEGYSVLKPFCYATISSLPLHGWMMRFLFVISYGFPYFERYENEFRTKYFWQTFLFQYFLCNSFLWLLHPNNATSLRLSSSQSIISLSILHCIITLLNTPRWEDMNYHDNVGRSWNIFFFSFEDAPPYTELLLTTTNNITTTDRCDNILLQLNIISFWV